MEEKEIKKMLIPKIHRWNKALDEERKEIEIKLDTLVQEYKEVGIGTNDIQTLERIKKEISGYLHYYVKFMSIARSHFEGTNYLESSRKWLKSYCISYLVENEEGLTSAAANRIVYDSDLYTIGMEIINSMKALFLNIDYKFNRYRAVERNIQQTISIVGKEMGITHNN